MEQKTIKSEFMTAQYQEEINRLTQEVILLKAYIRQLESVNKEDDQNAAE
ncbi:hypothetical protein [Pseudobacillus badius]|nr:hypothetical protein [Bacillus badius]